MTSSRASYPGAVSGGTQTGPGVQGTRFGTFGKAAVNAPKSGYCGAGGGWYGGNSITYAAGGGSGYIGYSDLTDKIMYCYNCQESTSEDDETNIKTRSTTNVSKITFIG